MNQACIVKLHASLWLSMTPQSTSAQASHALSRYHTVTGGVCNFFRERKERATPALPICLIFDPGKMGICAKQASVYMKLTQCNFLNERKRNAKLIKMGKTMKTKTKLRLKITRKLKLNNKSQRKSHWLYRKVTIFNWSKCHESATVPANCSAILATCNDLQVTRSHRQYHFKQMFYNKYAYLVPRTANRNNKRQFYYFSRIQVFLFRISDSEGRGFESRPFRF